jgi:hypothetical protein
MKKYFREIRTYCIMDSPWKDKKISVSLFAVCVSLPTMSRYTPQTFPKIRLKSRAQPWLSLK